MDHIHSQSVTEQFYLNFFAVFFHAEEGEGGHFSWDFFPGGFYPYTIGIRQLGEPSFTFYRNPVLKKTLCRGAKLLELKLFYFINEERTLFY